MKPFYLNILGLQTYTQVWDVQEQLFAETVSAKTFNRDNPDGPKQEVQDRQIERADQAGRALPDRAHAHRAVQ